MFNLGTKSGSGWIMFAVVCAAAILSIALPSSRTAAGGIGNWTLVSVQGTVTVDGDAVGAPNLKLAQGTLLETGSDGKAVLTRPGDSITVYPNSRMAIPRTDNGEEAGVMQMLGKLLFRMESRESRDFEVKTPYLAAAIKGTTFTVEVNGEDAAVEVAEGSVLVSSNRSGQSAYVGPGERASVSSDHADSVQLSDDDGIESGGEGVRDGTSDSRADDGADDSSGKSGSSDGSNSGSDDNGSGDH